MTDDEKMLWMFKQVHGVMSGSCYLEVDHEFVHVMKDGCSCWSASKLDLAFECVFIMLREQEDLKC